MTSKFLYAEIYDSLLKSIISGEYPSGELLPSEKELCGKYLVSLITIRRTLKELADYGIVLKIKGKGTQVISSIRNSSNIINKNIGVFDVQNTTQANNRYPEVPFDSSIYDRNDWKNIIYTELYEELFPDYNLILGSYKKEEIINDYENTVFKNIERIFVLGLYDNELIEFLHSKGKLVVVYNNFDKNIEVCNVTSNERKKCREAVEYLIKLGHKKIASINGDITFSESIERSMGYQEALMQHHIPMDSLLVKWGNMTAESGYHLMKQILDQGGKPTAAICVNDNVAAGVLLAIQEYGLSCPSDISLFGHDNNNFICPITNPLLSSIDPNYGKIGKEVARKIKRDIWIDDSSVIDCKIILRDSIQQNPQEISQAV